MNRGMVVKRAQYSINPKTGKRNKRIKTVTDLARIVSYLDEGGHENHDGIRLRGICYWGATKANFVGTIENQAAGYQLSSIGRPGGEWSGDIGEHLIVCPDDGADLSTEEEAKIVDGILARICPASPAAYEWHFNPKTKRSELHIVVGSFTHDFPPRLRVTELRYRHAADYLVLLEEAGEAVLREVNLARRRSGQPTIRSLENIRTAKKDEIVSLISTAAEISHSVPQTIQDILDLVRSTEWNVVKHTNTSVSLQAPHSKTPLHIRWEELMASIRHDLALNVAEREREVHDEKKKSLSYARDAEVDVPSSSVPLLEM